MACKMSQEFPTAALDITEDFHILQCLHIYLLMFIPFSKQKHKTGSLTHTHTHTHTHDHQQLQTKSNWARQHLLLMVISLAQKLLSCAKFRPLRVKKKDLILLTLDRLWGRPRRRLCSNERMFQAAVRVGLANDTKRTPSQNRGYLLSEPLHVPHSVWPAFLKPSLLLLSVQKIL